MLCSPPACPTTGKYLQTAVPEVKKYTDTSVTPSRDIAADEYVIGLVQYRTSFSSDLPPTLVRGYVQLETPANAGVSQHFPLTNANVDPTKPDTPVLVNGVQALGVTPPQYLGPIIAATKDKPDPDRLPQPPADRCRRRPVPADRQPMMGSGMGPMAMADPTDQKTTDDASATRSALRAPSPPTCFKDDRATLHLHGGTTPWISDGTPHQWITPAGETTAWPQGVSVQNVPDMTDAGGATTCAAADDGCLTFYYTNQQSARLMFYHDHSWGITRLNVYAGEAAGYIITDATEKKLVADGAIPGAADTLPLIIQDRTFVPGRPAQGARTQRRSRYGRTPPGTPPAGAARASSGTTTSTCPRRTRRPSGMSAYGRWMYGPWFWPPATGTQVRADPEPLLRPNLQARRAGHLAVPDRPVLRAGADPGTPNISAGMEQFNDTPLVNGVAYPNITLQPKTYRLRMLNAANDRFFNFQWYIADPDQGDGTTEVALKPAEVARGADRPERVTDTGRHPQRRRRARLGADRQRGRLPARPRGHRRPAADHLDHRPDPLRLRQRRQALDAAGSGRASRRRRGLLEVRGQDADPLQRRTRGLPGPRARLRLLHGRPGPEPDRRADHLARATGPTPAPSCR